MKKLTLNKTTECFIRSHVLDLIKPKEDIYIEEFTKKFNNIIKNTNFYKSFVKYCKSIFKDKFNKNNIWINFLGVPNFKLGYNANQEDTNITLEVIYIFKCPHPYYYDLLDNYLFKLVLNEYNNIGKLIDDFKNDYLSQAKAFYDNAVEELKSI